MKVSANLLKWVLRFYPPLLLQRIWVKRLSTGFDSVEVTVYKSLLNTNYNGTIFGGTIYAATDAFYPVLYHQLLTHAGCKVIVWVKSAQIQYLKPGRSSLTFRLNIDKEELISIKHILETEGKIISNYITELFGAEGELCAVVNTEVYIRNLNFIFPQPVN